ncbi:DUF547 domain-containing protein [Flavobacterium jejuense]|nr:DUF547 domain-containing protein [Flavobacterium jejuense]
MKQLFFLSLLLIMVSSCRFNKKDESSTIDKNELDSIDIQVETNEEIGGDTKMGSSKTNTIPEGVKNVDSKESLENSKKEKVGKSQTTEEIINEPEVVKEIIEEKVESVDIDHSEWNALLKKNVSNTGNVNYRGFIRDKAMLENYLNTLATKIPDETWSKNAKLAYWINVYNAFTVKLIVDNYPIKSIKDISNPWEKKFFTLEGSNYSLEQVENEILRKMNEPRIHFAINCASYSCPNLANQAYTSNTMERQLTDASKKFINDSSKNNISENEIKISEIFNWFSKDFKNTNTSVIDFLNKYSATKISNEAKVSYLDYNWSLNE